jgi:hypothetical protein
VKRLILACLAALLTALVPAPADAATSAKSKAAKAKVVCFKKTVKTKSGRKVRKTVCRPRRKAKKAPARTPITPSANAPELPKNVEGPAPSPVLGSPAAPTAAVPAVSAPVCVPEDSEWLTVTALDENAKFILRLSRTCLRAGRTIVQLQNQDAQEHDLWAEGTAPVVAKREVVTSAAPESLEQAETTLSAGEWRLFCSIPGHGTMSRTVSVVG